MPIHGTSPAKEAVRRLQGNGAMKYNAMLSVAIDDAMDAMDAMDTMDTIYCRLQIV